MTKIKETIIQQNKQKLKLKKIMPVLGGRLCE